MSAGIKLFLAAAMLLAGLYPSLAAEKRVMEKHHDSEYSIALGILPIARARFSTSMNGPRYAISGSFSTAGLASLLKDISGETTVSGAKRGNKLQASTYSLVYKDGAKTRTYAVRFQNGNVTASSVRPETETTTESWVPVAERDLRAVLDPISGLIFPASGRICPRRLPIYDGESRMDLILTAQGSKPFKTDGFSGDAVVCTLRYVPKSGFRKGRTDIEYLKTISMEVWFAKADAMNVYAPVYARIPTQLGQVYITATKYGG